MHHHHSESEESSWRQYYPLIVIAIYIIGITFINNFNGAIIHWQAWMYQFMAAFFLVFSAFKFLDLKGFAEGYATYDLLAQRFYFYGYIYPFIELSLGILYLTKWELMFTNIVTIVVMGFSSLGVINSLRKKTTISMRLFGYIH